MIACCEAFFGVCVDFCYLKNWHRLWSRTTVNWPQPARLRRHSFYSELGNGWIYLSEHQQLTDDRANIDKRANIRVTGRGRTRRWSRMVWSNESESAIIQTTANVSMLGCPRSRWRPPLTHDGVETKSMTHSSAGVELSSLKLWTGLPIN